VFCDLFCEGAPDPLFDNQIPKTKHKILNTKHKIPNTKKNETKFPNHGFSAKAQLVKATTTNRGIV
jgi:hypothetical protein